jgi:hypothetical protein
MTYIVAINSFADAEERYNNTKPVRSKVHPKEHDVRPLGKRVRKYERIIKISDTCYALSCGGMQDPVFNWGYNMGKPNIISNEEVALLSPVVWRKHEDGTETVTVRNARLDQSGQAMYSFIHRTIPYGLCFSQTNKGIQYIRNGSQLVYFPKTKAVPKHIMDYRIAEMNKSPNEWNIAMVENSVAGDDGLSLTFKRVGHGVFTLLGEPPKVPKVYRRVNKELKAHHQTHINGMFDRVVALYPLMQDTVSNPMARRDEVQKINAITKEHNYGSIYVNVWQEPVFFGRTNYELVRKIIADEQHPLYFSLMLSAMYAVREAAECNYVNFTSEEADVQRKKDARAAYNKWVNAVLQLMTTIKEVV